MQLTTPRPVASRRPSEPPISIGFPVTTPGTLNPFCCEYVSMIHAITCSFVPRSGAGMSRSGPITSMISEVKRRVMRCSSLAENSEGSMRTPPFAPPNGRFMMAHFHDISIASAVTSPRLTPRS